MIDLDLDLVPRALAAALALWAAVGLVRDTLELRRLRRRKMAAPWLRKVLRREL